MALDPQGGPNWVNNFVDSPIIVNATSNEYYKQPMYYALGHFSRFIPPGSRPLTIKQTPKDLLDVIILATPDNATVAVVLNRFQSNIPLEINDLKYGTLITTVDSHSIQTFVWYD